MMPGGRTPGKRSRVNALPPLGSRANVASPGLPLAAWRDCDQTGVQLADITSRLAVRAVQRLPVQDYMERRGRA